MLKILGVEKTSNLKAPKFFYSEFCKGVAKLNPGESLVVSIKQYALGPDEKDYLSHVRDLLECFINTHKIPKDTYYSVEFSSALGDPSAISVSCTHSETPSLFN